MQPGPLQAKSYAFALAIIDVCDKLNRSREYVLSKQLLKSGTSIGANIEESQLAQSRKDFISKIHIAAKEAYETRFWLRLLRDSKKLSMEESAQLIRDVEEIIRMLVVTLKTLKE